MKYTVTAWHLGKGATEEDVEEFQDFLCAKGFEPSPVTKFFTVKLDREGEPEESWDSTAKLDGLIEAYFAGKEKN